MHRALVAFCRVAVVAAAISACGAADATGTPPLDTGTGSVDDQVAQPDTDLDEVADTTVRGPEFGPVDDFEQGINEVIHPRAVFVIVDGDEFSALDRKDPNNGCRLLAIDDEAAAEFDISNPDARFFDQCHGNVYDIDGGPLHCEQARPMAAISVLVDEGIARWDTMTIDPDAPAPVSRHQCPDGGGSAGSDAGWEH